MEPPFDVDRMPAPPPLDVDRMPAPHHGRHNGPLTPPPSPVVEVVSDGDLDGGLLTHYAHYTIEHVDGTPPKVGARYILMEVE